MYNLIGCKAWGRRIFLHFPLSPMTFLINTGFPRLTILFFYHYPSPGLKAQWAAQHVGSIPLPSPLPSGRQCTWRVCGCSVPCHDRAGIEQNQEAGETDQETVLAYSLIWGEGGRGFMSTKGTLVWNAVRAWCYTNSLGSVKMFRFCGILIPDSWKL